jgi:hypothetical protein
MRRASALINSTRSLPVVANPTFCLPREATFTCCTGRTMHIVRSFVDVVRVTSDAHLGPVAATRPGQPAMASHPLHAGPAQRGQQDQPAVGGHPGLHILDHPTPNRCTLSSPGSSRRWKPKLPGADYLRIARAFSISRSIGATLDAQIRRCRRVDGADPIGSSRVGRHCPAGWGADRTVSRNSVQSNGTEWTPGEFVLEVQRSAGESARSAAVN